MVSRAIAYLARALCHIYKALDTSETSQNNTDNETNKEEPNIRPHILPGHDTLRNDMIKIIGEAVLLSLSYP